MTEDATPRRRPLVVGANHRSSSLGLRDRLFVEEADVPAFLGRLREAGVDEAVVLSTCDRVEVQALHADPAAAAAAICVALAEHGQVAAGDLDGQTYTIADDAAVRHIFSVTAALDSQVIGESEVLGQVKAGHRLAREAGMTDGGLESILQAAYGSAKRVRTETDIGKRPVTIAAAAVEVARGLHGDLRRASGLLLGAGEMGEMIAVQLLEAGLGHLTVTHPVPSRAQSIARGLDCHRAEFEDFEDLLGGGDIVVCALGRRQHAVVPDIVKTALKRRRRKPMFFIDVAVPGDVESAVNDLDGAFLFDFDDLERVALEGRASRQQEADKARSIVEAEVEVFLRDRAERAAVPAVSQLRAHVEAIRDEVLAEAGDDAEKATRLLVSRLLHAPSSELRNAAATEADDLETAENVVRRLFGLDREATKGEDEPQ